MSAVLSVGIVLQSNFRGGPQKISTIAALDLARQGHKVSLFLPVLPYYYYYVSLGKRPLLWARVVLPYVKDWARGRKFVFQDILDDSSAGERVSVRFVPRRASRGQLEGLDCLIIHAADKIVEYRNVFPQDRQIYLLHHPEEHAHGHAAEFKKLRASFRGRILTISPFTARQLAEDNLDLRVVPNPISPQTWGKRHSFDLQAARRDLVLFWKGGGGLADGIETMRALEKQRPATTVTVWCRHPAHVKTIRATFPRADIVGDLSERDLCELFLGHSLLLFPSTCEGFGMPPVEALACGCIPVLHPQVGAAEMYARNGENSIYWEGQPEELAGQIKIVLDSPKVLEAMRQAGPESIGTFNPDGYGHRLLQAAGVL